MAGCTSTPPEGAAPATPTLPATDGPRYAPADADLCAALESDELSATPRSVMPGLEFSLHGVNAPDLGDGSPMAGVIECSFIASSEELYGWSSGDVSLIVFHEPEHAKTFYDDSVTGEGTRIEAERTESVSGRWDEATYLQTRQPFRGREQTTSVYLAHHGNLYLRVHYTGTFEDADIPPEDAAGKIRSVATAVLEHALAHAPCEERCP
jgi:hypothetical protein